MNKFKSAVSQMAIVAGLALSINATASADQQFLDDVIVDGSLCVGQDCVNGESFGFDTLRLKENNLRIHFQDTSVSASFPTTDWRIVANDSSNGGSNHFSIEDSTAGRTPFRIEGSAPTDSLVVEDSGQIGIGTRTPVVNMHVVDGNTPTLRLEQDGSSGFTPQTFDVAANETNFFIRDATNGSRLFFRAKPGAPADSIFIAADGDIGLGTDAPAVPLHVRRNGSNEMLRLSNTDASGSVTMTMDPGGDGVRWKLKAGSSNGSFILSHTGISGEQLALTTDGNLTIAGEITTSGSCSGGCDAVFAPDYELPSIDEHRDFMMENRYLMHVGPTAEEGPMNLSTKVGGMLSELEYAHLYIADLHDRQEAMEQRLAELTQRLAD